jgi:prepilin-type N-terminal cleavage/methylation domain-containing protein
MEFKGDSLITDTLMENNVGIILVKQRAYTLIEMLLVIVVMSLIAVGIVHVTNRYSEATLINRTVEDMRLLLNQAQYYRVVKGEWPENISSFDSATDFSKLICSPWPASSKSENCGNLQVYQGEVSPDNNLYQLSITTPSPLIANKIKKLLPQASIAGNTVTAYSTAFAAGIEQEQNYRIVAMDTSYCDTSGGGTDDSHNCWLQKTPQYKVTQDYEQCPSGSSHVIFPILTSYDRGYVDTSGYPSYNDTNYGVPRVDEDDSSSAICWNGTEIGLQMNSDASSRSFFFRPFVSMSIYSSDNPEYVNTSGCYERMTYEIGTNIRDEGSRGIYLASNRSTVTFFITCVPNTEYKGADNSKYPDPYMQYFPYYNVGCIEGSHCGAYSDLYSDNCFLRPEDGKELSDYIYGCSKKPISLMGDNW